MTRFRRDEGMASIDNGIPIEFAPVTMIDPHPERRSPEYCWRSWPPRHTDECGCAEPMPGKFSPLAPPPLDELAPDTMLAVASVPGKVPEEWRPVTPWCWVAWPHAAGAWVWAREMTAAQLRDLLTARDSRG